MSDEHARRTSRTEGKTVHQRIRDEYRKETGHDLPEHVIDNIEKVQLYSPPWKHSDTARTSSGIVGGDGIESISPVVMTACAWLVAAGAYGYLAASYPDGNYPDIGGIFLVLGIGVGAGIAGLLAIMARKSRDENAE